MVTNSHSLTVLSHWLSHITFTLPSTQIPKELLHLISLFAHSYQSHFATKEPFKGKDIILSNKNLSAHKTKETSEQSVCFQHPLFENEKNVWSFTFEMIELSRDDLECFVGVCSDTQFKSKTTVVCKARHVLWVYFFLDRVFFNL